jgi:hypothetical protein
MGGENLSLHAPYWALFRHWSPSRVNTTSTVPRDSGDSALSVHCRPTSTRPRPGLDQPTVKACVTQGSESFYRLILYVTMVSGDGRPFSGHVATATSTAIDKTSPQRHPRCPCLLLPYKRVGRGLYKGGTENNRRRKENQSPSHQRDQHLKQSPLYSRFFSETWDWFPLSQLVTPTQALRCKEIQYSPLPAGRRAFFCPNQDKPPCTLLASSSRLGTHNIDSLIGLGPS